MWSRYDKLYLTRSFVYSNQVLDNVADIPLCPDYKVFHGHNETKWKISDEKNVPDEEIKGQ